MLDRLLLLLQCMESLHEQPGLLAILVSQRQREAIGRLACIRIDLEHASPHRDGLIFFRFVPEAAAKQIQCFRIVGLKTYDSLQQARFLGEVLFFLFDQGPVEEAIRIGGCKPRSQCEFGARLVGAVHIGENASAVQACRGKLGRQFDGLCSLIERAGQVFAVGQCHGQIQMSFTRARRSICHLAKDRNRILRFTDAVIYFCQCGEHFDVVRRRRPGLFKKNLSLPQLSARSKSHRLR